MGGRRRDHARGRHVLLDRRADARLTALPGAACSVPYLDVAAGGVLDRLDLAAAGLSRRHFGGILVFEPLHPIGPPRAGPLLGLVDPALETAERRSVAPID